jgi:hypothetical protein
MRRCEVGAQVERQPSSSFGDLVVTIVAIGMSLPLAWVDPKSPIRSASALVFVRARRRPLPRRAEQRHCVAGLDMLWAGAFSIGESAATITLMKWL